MNTKKHLVSFGIALLLALPLAGCSDSLSTESNLTTRSAALVQVDGVDSEHCVTLYAGQTIDAGTVCVAVEGDNLLISYDTFGGWELVEAHAWVGEDLADMPQTRKGAPKIGNFPYNSGDISGATSFTFSVPLDSLGGEPYVCGRDFFVAAHAALQRFDVRSGSYQTETGWGDGERMVQRGTWATYFTFTLVCDEEPPAPEGDCETAFAFGGDAATTFDSLIDTPRWGWSNGPLEPGSYTFDVYAGAGQNDISKGTLVGTLEVDYDGSSALVTFQMLPGFTLEETHLYVGSDPLAKDVKGEFTVAPGQYPYQHELGDAASDSYSVSGLSGTIYVVAHGVSCGSDG